MIHTPESESDGVLRQCLVTEVCDGRAAAAVALRVQGECAHWAPAGDRRVLMQSVGCQKLTVFNGTLLE